MAKGRQLSFLCRRTGLTVLWGQNCPMPPAPVAAGPSVAPTPDAAGPSARWLAACNARATSSLPVPDSPLINTVMLECERRPMARNTSCIAGASPMISGLLAGSVHSQFGDDYTMIGAARPYARIHQLGGKAGRGRKVTIPARPYLPFTPDFKLQPEAEKALLQTAMDHLRRAAAE